MSRRLPEAEHLTDKEYSILILTYSDHNASMGLKKRVDYTISDIVKIERDIPDERIKVYYNTGEWWYYTSKREWY